MLPNRIMLRTALLLIASSELSYYPSIVVLYTSEPNASASRAAIRNSWTSTQVAYTFVIKNAYVLTPALNTEINTYHDIVWSYGPDTNNTYHWAISTYPNLEWIATVQDDHVVWPSRLQKRLEMFQTHLPIMIGCFGDVHFEKCGYFINKHAVNQPIKIRMEVTSEHTLHHLEITCLQKYLSD